MTQLGARLAKTFKNFFQFFRAFPTFGVYLNKALKIGNDKIEKIKKIETFPSSIYLKKKGGFENEPLIGVNFVRFRD